MLLFEKNEERFFYGSSRPRGNVLPHGNPAGKHPDGSVRPDFDAVPFFEHVRYVTLFGFSKTVERAVRN